MSKNSFDILGYKVSYKKLTANPEKVKALRNAECPKTLRNLQQFLGSLQYFRRTLPLRVGGCVSILNEYCSDKKFVKDERLKQTFEAVKEGLLELSTYKPTMNSINIVFSDASANFYGGILVNVQYGQLFDKKHCFEMKTIDLEWRQREYETEQGWINELQPIDFDKSIIRLLFRLFETLDVAESDFSNFTKNLLRSVFHNGREYDSYLPYEEVKERQDFFSRVFQTAVTTLPAKKLLNELELEYLEHFLLLECVKLSKRQIIFIVTEGRGYFFLGIPQVKSPILITKSKEGYCLLKSEKEYLSFPATLTKYHEHIPIPALMKIIEKVLEKGSSDLQVRPIAFNTKRFSKSQQGHPIWVKELCAIVENLKFFKNDTLEVPTCYPIIYPLSM